ncbi:MAG: hypothetical protein R3F59_27055 [Myxococcota bacterium]
MIWLALCAAPSDAAPVRRVEASAGPAALTAALLPQDGADYTVCEADCPVGVSRVVVARPGLDLVGRSVRGRGHVSLDLALVGTVEADVSCSGAPVLLPGGQLTVQPGACTVERLGGGISPWLRGGVTRSVQAALDALVALQVQQAGPYDLLGDARAGLLAPYAADPALAPPAAARCVQGLSSLEVRPGAVVLGVDVGC